MTAPKHARKKRSKAPLVALVVAIVALTAGLIVYYLFSQTLDGTGVPVELSEVSPDSSQAPGSAALSDAEAETGLQSPCQSTGPTSSQTGEPAATLSENTESTEMIQQSGGGVAHPKELLLNIYFSDSQGERLVGEKRLITGPDFLHNALSELVAGPREPDHYKTVPDGTKLLGAWVDGNTAYVNFSRELVDNHWKGAAAETMTVYSIVNTATELPGIELVQVLVSGVKISSIDGHIDLSVPLKRNPSLIGG